ncbi:alpha-L-fucosidase [Nematostella vectensis]|uniref:alpha-L-fucosidase n=1 Tax=Nematostella vectensis TaxID=45351 RepID=UPI00139065B0|nr:alpha-L-fucosidase [Nematostella vectensis]
MSLRCLLFVIAVVGTVTPCISKYLPTWESLDSRPNPGWYDKAKFGIFMHWGLYSVPSYGDGEASEWFWKYWHDGSSANVNFMKKNFPPGFTYADFGPMFKAEFFDPDVFANLIAKSGAKYFVLTSKHHEGWTMWKSNVSWNWNSVDNGPHRDLVGELAKSIRTKTNVTFGLYHSLYEWFNPLYLQDKANDFRTNDYVKDIMTPQLMDLVNSYKPEYIWSDGEWEATSDYWGSKEFLAWLFNESPVKDTVLVNDGWGKNCLCKHGSVWTCSSRYYPGHLLKHKWENAMSVDKGSWGYRRNAGINDYFTIEELIAKLMATISCGGNMLMNVGPTADGRIAPIHQERMLQMGKWLAVNGEAVYETKPWRSQNDTVAKNVWYTSTADAFYACVLDWPSASHLILGEPITTTNTQVTMLGYPTPFRWTAYSSKSGIVIEIPAIPVDKLPTTWAWVFKFVNAS